VGGAGAEATAKNSGTRRLYITDLHDHRPTLFPLPALVLVTRDLLDGISMLVEAREMPPHSGWRTFDVIKRCVCDQDSNER
jgi:hypothetical protein